MKTKIPILLIYSRLAIAYIFILLAFIKPNCVSLLLGVLVTIGLLSDVFDGIIARLLKISSPDLRLLDTKVDRVFWLSAVFCLGMIHPAFILNNIAKLSILLFLEFLAWLVGYVRFGQGISFHSLISKFWAISILIMFFEILITGRNGVLFEFCFYHGLIAQLEIVTISFLLPYWQNDIPSVWHAWQIKKGKTIKRNKIFNG